MATAIARVATAMIPSNRPRRGCPEKRRAEKPQDACNTDAATQITRFTKRLFEGSQMIPLRQDVAVRLDFSFPVGESERHMVHFSFDQFWGSLSISVDGKPVVRDWRFLSFNLTKEYRFIVGDKERHDIVIVQARKLAFAGFRSQTCRVFIDGTQAGLYSS